MGSVLTWNCPSFRKKGCIVEMYLETGLKLFDNFTSCGNDDEYQIVLLCVLTLK